MSRAMVCVAALLVLIAARPARATLVDCGEYCGTSCTTESGVTLTSESIEHREWISTAPVIAPVTLYRATHAKQMQHCTSADQYELLFAAVTSGVHGSYGIDGADTDVGTTNADTAGGGYTLDQDGSTLWSADRSDRVYRCAAPVFRHGSHLAALSSSSLVSGYRSEWFERFEHRNEWTRTVCITDCCGGSVSPATVPEPSTVVLFGLGVVGLSGMARRVRRSA